MQEVMGEFSVKYCFLGKFYIRIFLSIFIMFVIKFIII